MLKPRFVRLLFMLSALCGVAGSLSLAQDEAAAAVADADELMALAPAKVVVIPVKDQIAEPVLYVIRRGLKQAIESEADLVILDMKTPGGSLGTTFEILEALDKFKGDTATYVNNEAISAGSFISAMTDDIYFAPDGVIGAAAPVTSGGADIDETMKQKIVSYLKARIRAISEGHPYRGQVISAMIDAKHELKIGDKVIKPEDELLSLTASEASETYGEPPQPLLAAGIYDSIDALLRTRYGERGFETVVLETTWSEDLAAWLNAVSPLLMGLGLLGVFIEFKTPGFGLFGILGGLLLATVFFGHYVAGLSGHEPALFFVIGAALVMVELVFMPGMVVFALTGVGLMLASLVWSMADLWPNEPITLSGDVFVGPLTQLLIALLIMIGGAAAAWRFLPHGWIFSRLALGGASMGAAQGGLMPLEGTAATSNPLVGRQGVAATDLFPSGKVEVDGRLYEARVAVGNVEEGEPVTVVGSDSFGLKVERTQA